MRRTRYTVTMHDTNAPHVVLAYDAVGAEDYYRRRGYAVAKVVKGDYRIEQRIAQGGWSINHANLAEAIELFGLKLPVTIKQTGHKGGRSGAHVWRHNPPRHCITVKSWLSAQEAGQTLWHELCHAAQVERHVQDFSDPRAVVTAWRTNPERRGSYANRPIEVEARSYEPFNDECPLATKGA